EAGYAGQGEREARGTAEDHQRGEGQQTGQDQAQEDDRAEQAVVEESVDRHQRHADRGGQQARLELGQAQRRGDRLGGGRLEGDRQRAVLDLVGQVLGRLWVALGG